MQPAVSSAARASPAIWRRHARACGTVKGSSCPIQTQPGRPTFPNVPGRATLQSCRAACSLSTVFQLRAVPRVPSFLSTSAAVRRERPTPSG